MPNSVLSKVLDSCNTIGNKLLVFPQTELSLNGFLDDLGLHKRELDFEFLNGRGDFILDEASSEQAWDHEDDHQESGTDVSDSDDLDDTLAMDDSPSQDDYWRDETLINDEYENNSEYLEFVPPSADSLASEIMDKEINDINREDETLQLEDSINETSGNEIDNSNQTWYEHDENESGVSDQDSYEYTEKETIDDVRNPITDELLFEYDPYHEDEQESSEHVTENLEENGESNIVDDFLDEKFPENDENTENNIYDSTEQGEPMTDESETETTEVDEQTSGLEDLPAGESPDNDPQSDNDQDDAVESVEIASKKAYKEWVSSWNSFGRNTHRPWVNEMTYPYRWHNFGFSPQQKKPLTKPKYSQNYAKALEDNDYDDDDDTDDVYQKDTEIDEDALPADTESISDTKRMRNRQMRYHGPWWPTYQDYFYNWFSRPQYLRQAPRSKESTNTVTIEKEIAREMEPMTVTIEKEKEIEPVTVIVEKTVTREMEPVTVTETESSIVMNEVTQEVYMTATVSVTATPSPVLTDLKAWPVAAQAVTVTAPCDANVMKSDSTELQCSGLIAAMIMMVMMQMV